MILPPLNDTHCLDKGHHTAEQLAGHPAVIEAANSFNSTAELAAYFRSRPQKLDFGDPNDGPRIACVPSQRLRLLPGSFNCFEATVNYLALAEAMDPSTPRTSCTIRVGKGYHTFPVERGLAVILDPQPPPRNAIDAGLYECQRRQGLRPSLIEAQESHRWLIRVAANAAQTPCEAQYVRNAVHALNRSIVGGQPLEDLRAIAHTIALAETDAGLWGEEGIDALEHAAHSVRNLQMSLDLGRFPGLAKRMGKHALKAYVVSQTGPVGLAVLQELERRSERKAEANKGRTAKRMISAKSGKQKNPLKAMTLH